MNFKRAKTILIILFVFVNIFLIFIYKFQILSNKKIADSSILSVLENNKITVDAKLLGNKRSKIKGIEVSYIGNDKENILKMLLGKKYEKTDENNYKNEYEKVTLSGNSFYYNGENLKSKGKNDVNSLNAGNKAIKFLGKKGFSKSSINAYNVSENSNNEYIVYVGYKYNELPLYNSDISVVINDKGVKSAKGSYIDFKPVKNQQYNVISVNDILMEFIDNPDISKYNNLHIKNVKLGYYLPMNGVEASTFAIPAYEISVKNGRTYYYDARENIDSSFVVLGYKGEIQ